MSWEDFVAFEGLLKKPDAEYDVSAYLNSAGMTRDNAGGASDSPTVR